MDTFLSILGSAALVVVAANVIGCFLPERYRAQGLLETSLGVSELWAALHDPNAHPVGGRMAKDVELLPDENGLPVWIENLGSSKVRVATVESQPERRVVRAMADQVVPMTARTEIDLEPMDSGGSRLRLQHEIVIKRGTWHVSMMRFMVALTRAARSGMQGYFRQFAPDGRWRWS